MPGQGGDGEVKDDPREAAFLYGNRNHEYSEAPTWKGDTMDKRDGRHICAACLKAEEKKG
jgi:hypothetical protein